MGDDERATGWHIEALLRTAEAHFWKAEDKATLEACDEGEALCQQGHFAEQHAALLYWRSKTLYSTERLWKSVESSKQALQILEISQTNWRLQGYLYTNLGRLYYTLPLDEVQKMLDTALMIAETHQFTNLKAEVLIRKGWVAINRLDRPEEALQLSQKALTITQSNEMVYEQITCHRLIADISRRLQLGEKALLHSQQAVTIARQSGMPRALHSALQALAVSRKQVTENWPESLKVMRQAVAIAESYQFPARLFIISNLSNLAIGLGLWAEAEQAIKLYRKTIIKKTNPVGWSGYYRQSGHLAYARGLFTEATRAYERALAVFNQRSSNERDFRYTQPYLGLALLEVGDLEQAVKHLKETCSYWQDRRTHGLARSLRGLARVELTQDPPIKAVMRLRQALAAIEGSNSGWPWPVWPYVCIDLGRALLMTGEHDEALEHALFGYEKFKKIGHFLLGEAAFVVGQILVAQGKQDEALAYLHEARDDWERLELTHHLPAWEAFMEEHGVGVGVYMPKRDGRPGKEHE